MYICMVKQIPLSLWFSFSLLHLFWKEHKAKNNRVVKQDGNFLELAMSVIFHTKKCSGKVWYLFRLLHPTLFARISHKTAMEGQLPVEIWTHLFWHIFVERLETWKWLSRQLYLILSRVTSSKHHTKYFFFSYEAAFLFADYTRV